MRSVWRVYIYIPPPPPGAQCGCRGYLPRVEASPLGPRVEDPSLWGNKKEMADCNYTHTTALSLTGGMLRILNLPSTLNPLSLSHLLRSRTPSVEVKKQPDELPGRTFSILWTAVVRYSTVYCALSTCPNKSLLSTVRCLLSIVLFVHCLLF